MSSLSPACTPLKHSYDECFQAWFVDYLAVAPPSSSGSTSPSSNTAGKKTEQESGFAWGRSAKKEESATETELKRRKGLRERLQGQCGPVWEQYRDCVRVSSLSERAGMVLERSSSSGGGTDA